jgi:hypothetical protein
MRKAILLIATVALFVLAFSSVALAASPQDIYNDYAQDKKLDGTYTVAELRAYLGDAGVRQYGATAVLAELDGVVKGLIALAEAGTDGQTPGTTAKPGTDGRSSYPFTGAELLIVALGGIALIGAGTVINRLGKNRA